MGSKASVFYIFLLPLLSTAQQHKELQMLFQFAECSATFVIIVSVYLLSDTFFSALYFFFLSFPVSLLTLQVTISQFNEDGFGKKTYCTNTDLDLSSGLQPEVHSTLL